jgi:circadian clock protein KaiC
VKKGLLHFHASRSTMYGLEMHLAMMHKLVREIEPRIVVIDPMNNLSRGGSHQDVVSTMTRLVDFLKLQGITAMLTSMTSQERLEETDSEVSSLVDTWLLLRDIELGGERNRGMYVLKSRGMPHSNQIREFHLTSRGIELTDVYLGAEGVLTGSARVSQEAREKAAVVQRQQEVEAKERELQRRREALEARITALRKEFEVESQEMERRVGQERSRAEVAKLERVRMGISRKADDGAGGPRTLGRPRKPQETHA